jgi:uncharacterized membrane protein YhaH (DUF805 family)
MNFKEAVVSGFRNYANFDSRALRSEFWYWNLFITILLIGEVVAASADALPRLVKLWSLIVFFPSMTVCVRRLHDIDRTGWGCLISVVPVLGLLLIYWACLKGTGGQNRFGPAPLASQAEKSRSPRQPPGLAR